MDSQVETSSNNIVLFGGTGNVGRHAVKTLSEFIQNSTQVRFRPANIYVVTRSPKSETAQALSNLPGVSLVEVDYQDQNADFSFLDGVSRMFVCLPQANSSDDMIKYGTLIAQKALEHGVKTIVRVSSLGIDENSSHYVQSQGPLGDAHVEVESEIRKLGLNLISVRPTSFFSNFTKYDLSSILEKDTFYSPLGTTAKVNWISCEDIGKVAAWALVQYEDKFRVLDITGPQENTFSAPEMQQLLSTLRGKAVTYNEIPIPDFPAYGELWKFLRNDGFKAETTTVKEVIGEQPESFEAWIQRTSAFESH